MKENFTRRLLFSAGLLISSLCFTQNIFLTKAIKTHENQDKFLYRIQELAKESIYLGDIEVQGFNSDDVFIFNEIYKKAKLIGANSYKLLSSENLENEIKFNPNNYKLQLFYTPRNSFKAEDNTIYILSQKDNKININKKKIKLLARSYIKVNLSPTEITDIAVKKILGTRIKLKYKENQPTQYYTISNAELKQNVFGEPGLHFKTGDIIMLEKSFAQFLITIYKENSL